MATSVKVGEFDLKSSEGNNKIKEGDYVIIRLGSSLSTCQVVVSKKVNFKRKKFYLDKTIGSYYGSTFKLVGTSLEFVPFTPDLEIEDEDKEDNNDVDLRDNRDLKDDGKSQKLTRDDIEILKEKGLSGEEIVGQLVENSQTFKDKSEYSKLKYLKKKKQKYSNYVTILKPTTRLLIEMYHAQGFLKIFGLRMDSLAQMLTLGNIFSGGKYMIVDTCLGLVTGAILERLGGLGKLVNIYLDHIPVYPVLNFYNFSATQRNCLMYLAINDVVKNKEKVAANVEMNVNSIEMNVANSEQTIEESSNSEQTIEEPSNSEQTIKETLNSEKTIKETSNSETARDLKRKHKEAVTTEILDLLSKRDMDGLFLICKTHPLNILRTLIPYLSLSRPFVVFCPYQQALIECYSKLKQDGNILRMNLSETFCRHYQILPNRTHPKISESGCSGFILTGITAEINSKT